MGHWNFPLLPPLPLGDYMPHGFSENVYLGGVSQKKFAKKSLRITELWPMFGGHSLWYYSLWPTGNCPSFPLPLLGILCHVNFLQEYTWGSFQKKVCKKITAHYRVMAPGLWSFISDNGLFEFGIRGHNSVMCHYFFANFFWESHRGILFRKIQVA